MGQQTHEPTLFPLNQDRKAESNLNLQQFFCFDTAAVNGGKKQTKKNQKQSTHTQKKIEIFKHKRSNTEDLKAFNRCRLTGRVYFQVCYIMNWRRYCHFKETHIHKFTFKA